MWKPVEIKIEDIYVPAARRKELDPQKVEAVAEEVMDDAEQEPIQVRKDNDRYVLIRGVNQLEARKALGDETIQVYLVGALQH